MKVVVTGSSGLVGSALREVLRSGGHEIVRLVRSQPDGPDAFAWDPDAKQVPPAAFAGADAVVHLAGENIAAGRWTEAQKRRIRDSRINGTQALAAAIANLPQPPKTLVCASAVGYYGDRGQEQLTESARPGIGFLPDVCVKWEEASKPAEDRGVRVVRLRFGVVLSAAGGALAKMLTPFKLGAGGKLGDGQQYMSWIDLDDLIGVIFHALYDGSLSGAVNAVSPNPVTNAEFTQTLGKVLHRPTVIPMPAFAARLVFGEMADALLLASARVIPARLKESGYTFRYPELQQSLRHQLSA
jgi:uncharacterized protein (TIGR01777 family)